MTREVTIAGRKIGDGHPCYFVAEIGGNHNGSFDTAMRLISEADDAGCDAVKFQYRLADYEIFDHDDQRYEFVKFVQEMSHENHQSLVLATQALGLACIYSAMSEEGMKAALSLQPDAIKIPSGEYDNPWLLNIVASSRLTMIYSTGFAGLSSITDALKVLRGQYSVYGQKVIILHCVSKYPTQLSEMDLLRISGLRDMFSSVVIGLSDHSCAVKQVASSVLLGASMIEVHITMDKGQAGPDHKASMTPLEISDMIEYAREFELAREDRNLGPRMIEGESFKNSLFARLTIDKGDPFTMGNLKGMKPGTLVGVDRLGEILGREATRDIVLGESLIDGDWK